MENWDGKHLNKLDVHLNKLDAPDSVWNSGSSPGLPSPAGSLRDDRWARRGRESWERSGWRAEGSGSPTICANTRWGMWRGGGQALLRLPRDRGWSWQCPKVLAASAVLCPGMCL